MSRESLHILMYRKGNVDPFRIFLHFAMNSISDFQHTAVTDISFKNLANDEVHIIALVNDCTFKSDLLGGSSFTNSPALSHSHGVFSSVIFNLK